jgi:hypothetical protein
MRTYCDSCDRDITDDANHVHVRLESNLNAYLTGRRPLTPKGIECCVECAKLQLAPVWDKLVAEKKNEKPDHKKGRTP